jgi:hypothetical protein
MNAITGMVMHSKCCISKAGDPDVRRALYEAASALSPLSITARLLPGVGIGRLTAGAGPDLVEPLEHLV